MRTLLVAAALVCFAATSRAQRDAAPVGDGPLALVHANVLDVRDGKITTDATVVLRGGRIESIGSGPAPAGVRVRDVKGNYVLPGLIDAHTHLVDFAALRRALESGVTTVRSSGVSNYADVGFRTLVKTGATTGLGVKIVAGGDTSYGPNSLTRIGQEMARFVETGFSTLAAIQSATLLNAEMLRLEKSTGVLEVGYDADLIAVEKNPLVDITTVQDPLLVISNGRVGLDRLDFAREPASPRPGNAP